MLKMCKASTKKKASQFVVKFLTQDFPDCDKAQKNICNTPTHSTTTFTLAHSP